MLATVPLVNGVGQLELAATTTTVTARAVDAQGAVIAERTFADNTASGPEPEVKGW